MSYKVIKVPIKEIYLQPTPEILKQVRAVAAERPVFISWGELDQNNNDYIRGLSAYLKRGVRFA